MGWWEGGIVNYYCGATVELGGGYAFGMDLLEKKLLHLNTGMVFFLHATGVRQPCRMKREGGENPPRTRRCNGQMSASGHWNHS